MKQVICDHANKFNYCVQIHCPHAKLHIKDIDKCYPGTCANNKGKDVKVKCIWYKEK